MDFASFGSIDFQVLVQAIVFFVIFIFGFAISIPLGLTVNEFENKCILYTDITWKNQSYFEYKTSSPILCNVPVGVAVFTCILYALGMALYNLYAVCKTKDPNVGFNMWVMPFILVNSLIFIGLFVISCMISVGLKNVCDKLEAGYQGKPKIKSCSDFQKINWNLSGKTNVNGSHFYSYVKAAEVAAWITVLLWLAQVGLYVLRFVRIRRFRAKDMGIPEMPAGARPEDLTNFAAANPSA